MMSSTRVYWVDLALIDWHREGRSISASNSRTIEMASVLSEGREKKCDR